jgi:hypothetical protein
MTDAAETRGRFERKVLISDLSAAHIEFLLKSHPLLFREIHHQRHINNIYFDTIERVMYLDAGEGAARRQKIRVRWYGGLVGEIDRPVLELKNKLGLVGWKDSFPMEPFSLTGDLGAASLTARLAVREDPGWFNRELAELEAVLVNRYSRRYFQSFHGHIRATIDTELTYYRVASQDGSPWTRYDNRAQTVLEFKYDAVDDDEVRLLLADSPFRLTKSSKYVQGIDLIYEW